jgi:hypothetical protein
MLPACIFATQLTPSVIVITLVIDFVIITVFVIVIVHLLSLWISYVYLSMGLDFSSSFS